MRPRDTYDSRPSFERGKRACSLRYSSAAAAASPALREALACANRALGDSVDGAAGSAALRGASGKGPGWSAGADGRGGGTTAMAARGAFGCGATAGAALGAAGPA